MFVECSYLIVNSNAITEIRLTFLFFIFIFPPLLILIIFNICYRHFQRNLPYPSVMLLRLHQPQTKEVSTWISSCVTTAKPVMIIRTRSFIPWEIHCMILVMPSCFVMHQIVEQKHIIKDVTLYPYSPSREESGYVCFADTKT